MGDDLLQLALVIEDDDILLLSAVLLEEEEDIHDLDKVTCRFDLASTSEEMCWKHFRFKKEHIIVLKNSLGIPDVIKLDNRSEFSGVDGICVLLKRLAYPCRLVELSCFFGRSCSDISRVITFLVTYIHDRFGDLLNNLDRPYLSTGNLSIFAEAIKNKGCPLDKCWGFIDGTIMPICRPKENQRQVFSGHKRVHCLKFQSLMPPNGIIYSLMGPF